MFLETPANINFAGYADDNTYACSSNMKNVLDNLQGALENMFHWFSTNHLVANVGKCHLLTSSKTPVNIHISHTEILNKERVLLGVNLEGRLNFDFHVNTLLEKASKKYHTLARMYSYMNKNKRTVLTNAFITSQFSYFALLWMPHSRTMNNRIDKIHEKALRLVYKDEINLFLDDLLKKGKSVSIHQQNLQILATEIYKVRNVLRPEIMKDIFHFVQKPYNLRNDSTLQRQRNRSVLWNRKHIFLCPQNMGDSPLRD